MVRESLTILQNQTQINNINKAHSKGHRPFHLSLYNLLCLLNDHGGCMIYTDLYIQSRFNTSELNRILRICEKKDFVKTIVRRGGNKDLIKHISEKHPNVNIFTSRKFVLLTEKGGQFIGEFSDYFEELEYVFENIMPRSIRRRK